MRTPLVSSSLTSLALLLLTKQAYSIDLEVNSSDSLLNAAKVVVGDILAIYNRNGTGPAIPGLLPAPYYWYEAGLTFDSLINYWSHSQDASVVAAVQEGLLFQVGPDNNFMPPNQTKSLGNDDQTTWALAAMTAAEYGFPTASNQPYSWVQLAQRVFDSQVPRWDTSSCNGGLRWQIFSFNNGYNYKNSISNGNLFQLAARLARFTGNQTYTDWAQKTLDWSRDVGLISSRGDIYDGSDDLINCTEIDHVQWSNNVGIYMKAASYLANSTQQQSWSAFNTVLLTRLPDVFVREPETSAPSTVSGDTILYEVACQPQGTCNQDQKAFLATLARSLAQVRDLTRPADSASQYAGSGRDAWIRSVLQNSAKGAAAACTGGSSQTLCGQDWASFKWDGSQGIGQQLSALEVFLANLPGKTLLTANTTTQTSTTVAGTTPATNTTSARPAGATGGASGLSIHLSLPLIMVGAVSVCMMAL